MRVGFDTSALCRPHPRGIARLVRSLTEALERRGVLDVVRLAPTPGRDLRAWRHGDLPRSVSEHSLAGLHSFTSAYPRKGPGKRVQTIHELPWRHGVSENAGWKHRYWAGLGSRRADAIVTATEVVARELRSSWFVRAERVHVCPWGVSDEFEEEPPPGVVDEAVTARYTRSEDPLALCPGADRAKKNLAALLRGLARLRERDGPRVHVLVTGEDSPDLRRDLGLASRLGLARWISTPGEIEEADWPAVLRSAAVVPVLSRSEGFGLPVLEALACGTPVLVPRDSAQAEVAGAHAFVVDPDDADSVADGLQRAIEAREELRYVLPERARELSWDRCAERIEALWQSLA